MQQKGERISVSSNKRKSVSWVCDENLECTKFFKQNDEPNAKGLSYEEVSEIQKLLVNVPSHMIPSELKNIEMKLDREKLQEQKGIESKIKEKLQAMNPILKFRLPQCKIIYCNCNGHMAVDVSRGLDYKQSKGEQSKEEQS